MRSRALITGALLALPAVAAASRLHTELTKSTPAEDAVLTEPPTAVTLTYTTAVQLSLSSVSVRAAVGGAAPVAAAELAYLDDDRQDVLLLALDEPLVGGSYVVEWTTAGPDGHALSGEFGFRVDDAAVDETVGAEVAAAPEAGLEPPGSGPAADAPGATPGDFAALLTRFAFYVGVVGLLGSVAFKLIVLGGAGSGGLPREVAEAASAGTWRIAALSAALLLIALPLRLWFQARALFPEDPGANLVSVTSGTPWSTGWLVHGAAVVLAAAGVVLGRRGDRRATGWQVVMAAALLVPLAPILSGHAWADAPRGLSVIATYLHVLAAGAWVGGLCCLLSAGLPAFRRAAGGNGEAWSGLPTLVGAFSRLALVAVGTLVVSGGVKAWLHMSAPSDLWTTPWGRSLLIKDFIVACVMAIGFYNWRVVRPALSADPDPAALRRSARAELAFGTAAVAATSWLVVQPL
ncbi:MAG: CopD family protein [Gemmatimonadota bacterium]|nr:CopD family protein [Gemmatimonadota bacterium]